MSGSSSKNRVSDTGTVSEAAPVGSRTPTAAAASPSVSLPSPDQSPSSHFFRRSVNSTAHQPPLARHLDKLTDQKASGTSDQAGSSNSSESAPISSLSMLTNPLPALCDSSFSGAQKPESSSSPTKSRTSSSPMVRKRKSIDDSTNSELDQATIKRERRKTVLIDGDDTVDINSNSSNTVNPENPIYSNSQQQESQSYNGYQPPSVPSTMTTNATGPASAIAASSGSDTNPSISSLQLTAPPTISSTSTSSRRHAHILSEQRRRENINGGFQLLKNSVPFCKGSQDSKAMILKKAVDYIASLEQQIQRVNYPPIPPNHQQQQQQQQMVSAEMYPQPPIQHPRPTSPSSSNRQPAPLPIVIPGPTHLQQPQPQYPSQQPQFYPQRPPSRSVTPAVPPRTQTPVYDASPSHPQQPYPYPTAPLARTETPPVLATGNAQATSPSNPYQYSATPTSFPPPLPIPRPASPSHNTASTQQNTQRSGHGYPPALGPRAASFSYSQRRRASTPFGLAAASVAANNASAITEIPEIPSKSAESASSDSKKHSPYAYAHPSPHYPSNVYSQRHPPPPPPALSPHPPQPQHANYPPSMPSANSPSYSHSAPGSAGLVGPGMSPSHGQYDQGQGPHHQHQGYSPSHRPPSGLGGVYPTPQHSLYGYGSHSYNHPHHQHHSGYPYSGGYNRHGGFGGPGITRPTSTPPMHGPCYSSSSTPPPHHLSQVPPPVPERIKSISATKEAAAPASAADKDQEKKKESLSDSETKEFGLPMPRPPVRTAYTTSSTSTSVSSTTSCISSASSTTTASLASLAREEKDVDQQYNDSNSNNTTPTYTHSNTTTASNSGSEYVLHKSNPAIHSGGVAALADAASKCDAISIPKPATAGASTASIQEEKSTGGSGINRYSPLAKILEKPFENTAA